MYGTMKEMGDSSLLLGSSRERHIRFGGSQKEKRPILETIVSKRRRRIPTIDQTAQPLSKSKSFLYTMLNPRSTEWQAVGFKWLISSVIILDLLTFIMSTDPDLDEQHEARYAAWEATVSCIFLTEYILRLIVVTESVKYGTMGPIQGRLNYMVSFVAVIDLAATLPYFLERFTGFDLPTLTYLRSFRLLRILKTQGFSEAIRSVCRVFRYNSEILVVGLWIGMAFVLFTAVLMYYLRPRDEEHEQFKSLPATLFLATMMLTGQGGPDGELPWYTSSVIVLTGIVSIGMFAIPASMLTWGFEGEAERLAKLRRKKATASLTREAPQPETDVNDDWSYSSDDYSTDEEYLNTIAGFESDNDDEEEKAKTFFRLADSDGNGNISMREFLEYSRTMSSNRETMDESHAAKRLDVLEKKVEENGKKLDGICEILKRMNHSQQ